jgi:hypothetical protein
VAHQTSAPAQEFLEEIKIGEKISNYAKLTKEINI